MWVLNKPPFLLAPPIGNLALSRAIGDFEFKKNNTLAPERQIITANPDIIQHDLTDDDEFLVIACDGRLPRFRIMIGVSHLFSSS